MKLILVLLFLTSCAYSSRNINSLNPGMSKDEVGSILGEPSSSRIIDGQSWLFYRLAEDAGAAPGRMLAGAFTFGASELIMVRNTWIVKFDKDGKLTSYGQPDEVGFNLKEIETKKMIYDVTTKTKK